MFTTAGEKVCMLSGCSASLPCTISDTTLLQTSSATCGGSKTKQLDVFCVDSCKDYYLAHCSALAANDLNGECQRPIEDNNVCVAATAADSTIGNSAGFKGCTTAETYLNDFVCGPCLIANGFIDY